MSSMRRDVKKKNRKIKDSVDLEAMFGHKPWWPETKAAIEALPEEPRRNFLIRRERVSAAFDEALAELNYRERDSRHIKDVLEESLDRIWNGIQGEKKLNGFKKKRT